MSTNIQTIRQSINKAYLRLKPARPAIELFKRNFMQLLDQINPKESEEHHKQLVINFIKDTWYTDQYYINTKGRTDLVIHMGKEASSKVGVIVEVKSPVNKTEMITREHLNAKALQELVLYYFRERIGGNNVVLKHLIITNIHEWFIFDAHDFEKHFGKNKELLAHFVDFEAGRLSGNTTDFFYTCVAQPAIAKVCESLNYAWFDIREFNPVVRNADKVDDVRLIPLFKIFSPEHLLKLQFANDSNSLDRKFYSELLHLIGLEESKDGGKKVIGRKEPGSRNAGSLLENAITILAAEDRISILDKPSQYGASMDEQLYQVGLELVITWINRVLFLKLLEGQLLRYHKKDPSYRFLTIENIPNFDSLNKLFFQILAVREIDRPEKIRAKYQKVPYLNSSLFEPSPIERKTLFISNLDDEYTIPILITTVLKDMQGKRVAGEKNSLDYLFAFLDAYDFTSEGSEEIQEENKSLINASVLGLIFEKINGYKDGSFYTPGFITMYMCRETLRRAVVQKFNEVKGWNCTDLDSVYNESKDRLEANRIINDLKICDPAVGSGHFLVSALNELIAIKSKLGILVDNAGRWLKEYNLEVINDELVITDEEGRFFEYRPGFPESQRVQETLFREKQTLIENCLFGVDINPNSVKICRLRLWIELLKNAYYKPDGTLETLPNIDINIKCGNSLVSRYQLDSDIRQALKGSKWTVESYRNAVMSYRNARTKDEKREMASLIDTIKRDFESEVLENDRRELRRHKLKGELDSLIKQGTLWDKTKKEQEVWNKNLAKLTEDFNMLDKELQEIRSNKIFENAFEWRFEFPEVLDQEGKFKGFDVMIGNPPYIPGKDLPIDVKNYIKQFYQLTSGKFDVYLTFIERCCELAIDKQNVCLIIPNTILANENAAITRQALISDKTLLSISLLETGVFEEAFVESVIIELFKRNDAFAFSILDSSFKPIKEIPFKNLLSSENMRIQPYNSEADEGIVEKLTKNTLKLNEIIDFCIGIQIGGHGDSHDFKKNYITKEQISSEYMKVIDGKDFNNYSINWPGIYIKYGDWLHRKRNTKYFENPKILIRQIGQTPFATIDYSSYYTLNTIYNGILKTQEYKLEFVFAIINSKLIKYFWLKKFYDNKILFPKIKKDQLDSIPIKTAGIELQNLITGYVKKLLNLVPLESDDTKIKIQELVDNLVYQLYGITEEEKAIIEMVK